MNCAISFVAISLSTANSPISFSSQSKFSMLSASDLFVARSFATYLRSSMILKSFSAHSSKFSMFLCSPIEISSITSDKELFQDNPLEIVVGEANFTSCIFSFCANTKSSGGAVLTNGKATTILFTSCDFFNCSAVDRAGALEISVSKSFTTNYCCFTHCMALKKCAVLEISASKMAEVSIKSSTISSNGLMSVPLISYINGGNQRLLGVNFSFNSAAEGSGVLSNSPFSFHCRVCAFVSNNGGKILFREELASKGEEIGNCLFLENRAKMSSVICGRIWSFADGICFWKNAANFLIDINIDSHLNLRAAVLDVSRSGGNVTNPHGGEVVFEEDCIFESNSPISYNIFFNIKPACFAFTVPQILTDTPAYFEIYELFTGTGGNPHAFGIIISLGTFLILFTMFYLRRRFFQRRIRP